MISSGDQPRKHAIVIGGSIAGLLAARVLSDHYAEVTLFDRDAFPSQPVQRRGVPQGRHAHGLLASGSDTLERLFPGLTVALTECGALSGDLAQDCRWFLAGACFARAASGMRGLLLSRPLLESVVRLRVGALPNVQIHEQALVESLVANGQRSRVTGVVVGGREFLADLVVDATGRASRSPQWLQNIGYQAPVEDIVHVALSYTTRLFERRQQDLAGDVAAVIPATPSGKRGGVMLAQERNQWTVTLIAHFGKSAPEELPGFVEYARTLPAPYIYDVIRNAAPLGEAATARISASVRRRYERLKRFPAGYLVTGDAICSFNPVYGQGMSVAALEAVELQNALATNPVSPARDFFRRAARVVDTPWQIAVGNDLRMPETVGKRTLRGRIANFYVSRVHQAAHRDPAVGIGFLQVSNLLAAPGSLIRPRIWHRVLRSSLSRRDSKTAVIHVVGHS